MTKMVISWTDETGFAELAEKLLASVERKDFTKEEVFFAFMAIRSTVIQLGFNIGDEEQKPVVEVPRGPEGAPGDATSVLMRAVEVSMAAVQIVQKQTEWLSRKHGEMDFFVQANRTDIELLREAIIGLGGKIDG